MATTIQLYTHQEEAVNAALPILKKYGIVCLAMEVRTGKTFTSLEIADRYGANKVLFVTKKKAIGSVLQDYQTLNPSFELTVINFESLHKVTDDYDIVITDEAHSLGAFPRPSKRTKLLKRLCIGKPIIFMSGTISPESYSQLYHILWVSSYSPWKNFRSFYAWAKAGYVNIKQRHFGATVANDYSNANSLKIANDINHLFYSVSQEEAGFDNKVFEHFLYVEMNDEQKSYMRQLKHDQMCKHKYHELYSIPSNGADLLNKMSQISGGTLFFDDEDKARVISPNKAHFIQMHFKGQKLAILYKYQAEYNILKMFFPNHTSDPYKFNHSDDLTFLAQIKSAQEGVNLSTADSLIMYNIDFSATSYFQARSRTQHKSRTTPSNVYWIFSKGGIEEKVYRAVSAKKKFTYSYYNKNK